MSSDNSIHTALPSSTLAGDHDVKTSGANHLHPADEDEEAARLQYDHNADTTNLDDEVADRELDEDLQWTSRRPRDGQTSPPLAVRIRRPRT